MSEHEHAFVRRWTCGHVVAVVVEDEELHYVTTVAAWKRVGATIERVTVEDARRLLGETFEAMESGRHHRKRGCPPETAAIRTALAGETR